MKDQPANARIKTWGRVIAPVLLFWVGYVAITLLAGFASWSAGNRAETGLLRMIVEDDALELTQQVATVSYLSMFGTLTVAFWLVYRRNARHAVAAAA